MHIALRAAGFSIMAAFVSCGVGAQAQAQDLDTRLGAHNGELMVFNSPAGASALTTGYARFVLSRH